MYCTAYMPYSTSFFFFKQKTAYEMRISDWSSDVCSSDLWTHRFHEARQWPIVEALRSLGATARPVLYRDEAVRAIRDELLSFDAVLVWVNPLDISGDRSLLDPMLREVAACGVVVSAHPDVIAKIGVKEVLYTTRSMEWGSDVDRYVEIGRAHV